MRTQLEYTGTLLRALCFHLVFECRLKFHRSVVQRASSCLTDRIRPSIMLSSKAPGSAGILPAARCCARRGRQGCLRSQGTPNQSSRNSPRTRRACYHQALDETPQTNPALPPRAAPDVGGCEPFLSGWKRAPVLLARDQRRSAVEPPGTLGSRHSARRSRRAWSRFFPEALQEPAYSTRSGDGRNRA